jgi:hypothetical protein
MPGQLHLNEEFKAEENVHTNILKKPPLPLREPQATTSRYKQAISHQRRKARRTSRQQ